MFTQLFLSPPGAGGGVAVCGCMCAVPLYFKEKRGLSSSLVMVGVCGGQMAMPLVSTALQYHLGYFGATLVYGAILLHCLPAAALLQPAHWHLKNRPCKHKRCIEKCSMRSDQEKSWQRCKNETPNEYDPLTCYGIIENSNNDIRQYDESDENQVLTQESTVNKRVNSHEELAVKIKSGVIYTRSYYTEKETSKPRKCRQFHSVMRRIKNSFFEYLRIRKYHRVQVIALSFAFCITGYYNFSMAVPFFVSTAGHSQYVAAW